MYHEPNPDFSNITFEAFLLGFIEHVHEKVLMEQPGYVALLPQFHQPIWHKLLLLIAANEFTNVAFPGLKEFIGDFSWNDSDPVSNKLQEVGTSLRSSFLHSPDDGLHMMLIDHPFQTDARLRRDVKDFGPLFEAGLGLINQSDLDHFVIKHRL